MACMRIEHGFVCGSPFFRLPLADGTRVYMSWHSYLGPLFFRDKHERREIEDWYESPLICDALDWFCKRGNRA
ncbi:hypothetical protein [Pseudomonas lutea]|jgi:hypothetical protein|uniref:Uncharacterized protein n=1 Tax=Pseudomonas lutea TaxID=243924 RepID=A0A9X0JK66_9PSED|nr:hypothetical protein [Pseudomonas lutea]KGF65595.1 hypothetical protein LT42_06655 [Pseudomonas lutea]